MNILLISGSGAQKSHTRSLLQYLADILTSREVKTTIIDLKTNPLPFAMAEYHRNPLETPNKDVVDFVKKVHQADAIILGTPLYHGSYSGVLKNALDSLNMDAFRNKPVGLVTNGGTRSVVSLEHLRGVVRTLYGYALQTQIATDGSDYLETADNYKLVNEEIKKRSVRFVDELLYLTHALNIQV